MRFDRLTKRFLEDLLIQGYKTSTIIGYNYALSLFGDWLGKNYPDAYNSERYISSEIVERYFKQLNSIGTSSKREYLKVIRTFSGYLIRTDRKRIDITRKIPPFKVERNQTGYLTEDQLKKAISKAKVVSERDYLILRLLLETGLRSGSPYKIYTSPIGDLKREDESFLGIRMEDINFDKNSIVINRTKMHPEGQLVYFTGELGGSLKRYIERQRLLYSNHEYLFYSKRGEPLAYSGLYRICRKYAGASPHKFRHSFGVLMRKQGHDLDLIAKWMGHKSITSTQIYAQIVDEMAYQKYQDNPFEDLEKG